MPPGAKPVRVLQMLWGGDDDAIRPSEHGILNRLVESQDGLLSDDVAVPVDDDRDIFGGADDGEVGEWVGKVGVDDVGVEPAGSARVLGAERGGEELPATGETVDLKTGLTLDDGVGGSIGDHAGDMRALVAEALCPDLEKGFHAAPLGRIEFAEFQNPHRVGLPKAC